jgi:small conductance mechanosensitive channel
MDFSQLAPRLQEWAVLYGIKVLAAVAIFVLGRWIVKGLVNLLKKVMTRRGIEPTLISFTSHMGYFLLLTIVVIAALSQIGIQTTSFIAILGAAGLAVGLALQGSLANFAAGVLMIIFRPFKAGDYVEGAGTAGTVEEVEIFSCTLRTPDNKRVIVPNGKMLGDNIVNYSALETRRIDMTFGVGYGDDLALVRKVIGEELGKDERVLREPAPQIAVAELGESSVDFVVRPWVKTADYWAVRFDLIEGIKVRFDQEGISIPFPQRDVHLYEEKK